MTTGMRRRRTCSSRRCCRYIGSDPDTPGPELAAYLDRFSLDDLASFVDVLRSPFKPGNSIYIHHAQEAMLRKRGMQTWLAQRYPDALNAPIPSDSYTELTLGERDDYLPLAYRSTSTRPGTR